MTGRSPWVLRVVAVAGLLATMVGLCAAEPESQKKLAWNQLEFAIVKLNDNPPISWNIYHGEKKGILLVHLWKRYLLVDLTEQEVYDIDPQQVKVQGDAVEWSFVNLPKEPINTPEWTARNVGSLERVRFRLGKDGHFLELQLPLALNGRPIY
jgi:hypothetical protein